MTRDEARAAVRGALHRIHADPYADRGEELVDAFELGLMAGSIETEWADAYVDIFISLSDAYRYNDEVISLMRAIP